MAEVKLKSLEFRRERQNEQFAIERFEIEGSGQRAQRHPGTKGQHSRIEIFDPLGLRITLVESRRFIGIESRVQQQIRPGIRDCRALIGLASLNGPSRSQPRHVPLQQQAQAAAFQIVVLCEFPHG